MRPDPPPWDCAVIDLRRISANTPEPVVAHLDTFWQKAYARTSERGSLWLLARDSYVRGQLVPIAHELIDRIRSFTEFKLKDIIVVYRPYATESRRRRPLLGAYFMIGHFVKSSDSSFFDKDIVREPHVFKEIEWGRRKIGKSGYSNKSRKRYNEKGRDPGNVFYSAERDHTTRKVLSVKSFSDSEVFTRLIRMSTRPTWSIATNSKSETLSKLARHLGRGLLRIEVRGDEETH
jgi:hypothetical protein